MKLDNLDSQARGKQGRGIILIENLLVGTLRTHAMHLLCHCVCHWGLRAEVSEVVRAWLIAFTVT